MRLKWKHLYENRDEENRSLFRRWLETGHAEDQKAWLRSEMRMGRTTAHALKMHVPDAIDDVRDEVVGGAGRALYVFAYAEQQERFADAGVPDAQVAGSGEDWMDIAPVTTRAAHRAGEALIRRIEQSNRLNINQLYWVAINMPGRRHRDPTPSLFGHYLAAEALGHGVGWSDDHPDPEIKLPHWDFDL